MNKTYIAPTLEIQHVLSSTLLSVSTGTSGMMLEFEVIQTSAGGITRGE